MLENTPIQWTSSLRVSESDLNMEEIHLLTYLSFPYKSFMEMWQAVVFRWKYSVPRKQKVLTYENSYEMIVNDLNEILFNLVWQFLLILLEAECTQFQTLMGYVILGPQI